MHVSACHLDANHGAHARLFSDMTAVAKNLACERVVTQATVLA